MSITADVNNALRETNLILQRTLQTKRDIQESERRTLESNLATIANSKGKSYKKLYALWLLYAAKTMQSQPNANTLASEEYYRLMQRFCMFCSPLLNRAGAFPDSLLSGLEDTLLQAQYF